MRIAKLSTTALAIVALAACSGGSDVDTDSADADGDGSVSVAEAADAVEASGLVTPQPGLYKVTSNVAGRDITLEQCITPEMVDGGYEEMMKENQDGECSYDKFEMSGGNLDAVLVCQTEQGPMTMSMKGTVSATSSDVEMQMAGMTIRSQQERIGDC
ncbi:MAG: DUF3617 domain-containing protein [Pseudomonadota bacterium]